jgi:hypothetical protein
MEFLQLEAVVSGVEYTYGRELNEMELACVNNAVDGYNRGKAGIVEIKQSMHEGVRGLLTIGTEELLKILDITEEVCDSQLRKGISESN